MPYKNGDVDPDDPRWTKVKWYKNLMEMHDFIKGIEVDGALL